MKVKISRAITPNSFKLSVNSIIVWRKQNYEVFGVVVITVTGHPRLKLSNFQGFLHSKCHHSLKYPIAAILLVYIFPFLERI